MTHLHSVNVWRGLWSLQSNYFLPGLQQVPFEMFLIQHISHNQDENYLLSHILGLAALSLLRVSNTIGNDNIVKVFLEEFQHATEIQISVCPSNIHFFFRIVRQARWRPSSTGVEEGAQAGRPRAKRRWSPLWNRTLSFWPHTFK